MKVVILCGGKGLRIREETDDKPKPMIPIGDRPIVWHIMKTYAHYGFNDFILCLGYKQEIIKDYFMRYAHMNSSFTINLNQQGLYYHDSHPENWNVTLVNTGLETKKGGRLKIVAPHITTDKFMLTYGDGVADINIKDLVDFHNSRGKKVTFTGIHPISRFATIETDADNEIISWSEKKQLEPYINGGFFVINKDALNYITSDCEWEEEPMQRLAAERQVAMYKHDGFWQCMDTFRDYKFLNDLWQNNQAKWKVW